MPQHEVCLCVVVGLRIQVSQSDQWPEWVSEWLSSSRFLPSSSETSPFTMTTETDVEESSFEIPFLVTYLHTYLCSHMTIRSRLAFRLYLLVIDYSIIEKKRNLVLICYSCMILGTCLTATKTLLFFTFSLLFQVSLPFFWNRRWWYNACCPWPPPCSPRRQESRRRGETRGVTGSGGGPIQ